MKYSQEGVRIPFIALLAGLGMMSTGAAVAGDLSGLCSGSTDLAIGQWARYASDAPFMREKVEARYAIVGEEAGHYWLEFEAAMPMGSGAMILKFLVPGWPYPKGSIKRVMMQMPQMAGGDSMPPMELPPGSAQKDNLSDPILLACEVLEKGVAESVTVPAGTFSATRIPLRRLGKDIWLSTSVPFGIVKLVDADNKGMELIAFGSDAEPAITEAPLTIPGMEQR